MIYTNLSVDILGHFASAPGSCGNLWALRVQNLVSTLSSCVSWPIITANRERFMGYWAVLCSKQMRQMITILIPF